MSDYGDDDADLDNPIFSRKTWVGIVVPLCVVAGIAFAVLVFFLRRGRTRRRRNGVSLNQQGRLALERDILEDGYGGLRSVSPTQTVLRVSRIDQSQGRNENQNQGIYLGRYFRGINSAGIVVGDRNAASSPRRGAGGRRQPRTANRWAWANTTDLTIISRELHRMEGLNELGEAPPPYEPPKKLPEPSGNNAQLPEHEEREESESAAEGITTPAPAHLRRGSGPSLSERSRSLDGGTIAATVTTTSTTATTATATTASSASRSRPISSTSSEGAAASLMIASSSASASLTSSTVATSPPASPPAYSERTAANQADQTDGC